MPSCVTRVARELGIECIDLRLRDEADENIVAAFKDRVRSKVLNATLQNQAVLINCKEGRSR